LADATGTSSGVVLTVSAEAVDGEAEGAVTKAGTPTAGPTLAFYQRSPQGLARHLDGKG
jgi:hypothetical protein